MAFPAIPSRMRCPNCSASFLVQVRTILDVGQEPEIKEQFLRGEINRAQCPECNTGGMLSAPLLYHDPAKELLVSYVPTELGLSAEDHERTVGNLVNAVMNGTPAEQRKGYFFQPKSVLTYNGLLELVLEAEGFSKELLERQRLWLTLISDLLDAQEDEAAFAKLVDQHRDALTYEFYLLLSEMIEAEEQRTPSGQESVLAALRTKLLERAAPVATRPPDTAAELIDLLLGVTNDEAWESTAIQHLQHLDYGFFQILTERLESAQERGDTEDAARFERLRQRLLDLLERQSRQLREAEDEASLLIMELLEATDLTSAMSAHADELDEVFFMVLARLQQTAARLSNPARAERLLTLLGVAREVRESKLPPDLRLISRLLRAQYPVESNRVLEDQRDLVSAQLLALYDRYVAQVSDEAGEAERERLAQIRTQIEAKLTVLRA